MEILFFLMSMLFLFVVIFIREAWQAKKNEKEFINSIYTNYGQIPKKEYSLERFARISSYYEKHRREGQIDDITWNDLNMDEVFKRLNNTFSASGEEYLYYTLRSADKTKEELEHLEAVVSFFMEHPDERVRIQFLMNSLGYTGKFSLYDYIDNLDFLGERSNRKHIIMNVLLLLCIAIIPFQVNLGIVGTIALMIYNIVSYFKEKNEISPYIVSFSYIMRLLQIADKMLKIRVPVCSREWEEIKKHRKALQGVDNGSFIVLSAGQGITSGNPLDFFLDYLRMIFHLDLMKFNKMLSVLRNHITDVDALITAFGYVDTAIAIGDFRKSLQEYALPEFVEEDLVLKDAYHPLIEEPIKNSIHTSRGVLLTGSNASGKSTFLKTVALNGILAQTIHTCTASVYQAPFYQVYSSMSLRDNLESGESYYIVEIKALKRILDVTQKGGRKVLCFVDEVLRGTNTVERIAASTQILKSLSNMNVQCFAATHDIELTSLLQEDYDNYHFEEEIRSGDVFFNYKLQPGKATTRNAIRLLEIMGYQPKIIERAVLMAEEFVKNGVWTYLT